MSKLEEVSNEMLVLMLPRVSSRVSSFPVASPCLWGKLQNLSFSKVSNCENWRQSRKKCRFAAPACLVSSPVFLWRCPVYGGSCKTSPFRRFPSRLSCRFAWHAWRFVTFQLVLYTPHPTLHTLHSQLPTLHSTLYALHSTLYTLHSTLYTLRCTLYTLHSTLYTPHSTLHSTLYTPHFTLYT